MESDILDILDQLGYEGPLSEEAGLLDACGRGFNSSEYVSLVTWLSCRLSRVTDTHTQESLITEDPHRCVSALLKDCCCPYEGLASRIMNGDIRETSDCLKILLFVASELQAAEMEACKHSSVCVKDSALQELRVVCETLQLPDPAGPHDLSAVQQQVTALLTQLPHTHLGEPAFKSTLRPDQWDALEEINGALAAEYECRRRMLIKRLDVTVQSFSWSDRAKVRVDRMARAYQPKRFCLPLQPAVCVAHLLAAREDVCYVRKTSSGSSRENTACAVNRILMGRVPDRGGRPSEIQAPLPEMPMWRKRTDGGGRGGGGRGGGGGGRWRRGGRGGQYHH
ncbi:protein FAM98B isoform X2 [Pimephales promelas]|uniref:protein FAM98B isoform X2 n=1 Tax=Pimephales promelas TaxID=90988 RepID=UPI001955D95B|nr:protein FAM98B isoform X2 [Pimephales promelas]KAG1936417.1 protein FAM98B [Pimephales promelas]KAG1936418.1 protein FAM98B [Pimephales promelas]